EVKESPRPSSSADQSAASARPKLLSTTQYDFVPGDRILFFDDFSQDAVGDFPALWTSNGSGEVKTVNIASGTWFHMNGEDAVYCYGKKIDFPDNFIIEFDVIPDEEYTHGATLTLYGDNPEEPMELNSDLYPGTAGLHITMKKEGWETKGYAGADEAWLEGQAVRNPLRPEQVNHVIIWVQQRRVRIYHQGAKVLDVPTNIHSGVTFDRLRFSGWDAGSCPMITNLQITTASPDTRSQLLTEGRLITYGITFDINKAEIMPESYGTLRSIADVLREHPGVNVRIVGHTDSDGDDSTNLALSKRRAESVKSELINTFSIEAARMETEGAGESQPVAANDTSVTKAKNRRVEFIKK
ncbi:OmpA family protein, partial [bacterium]|nr:OmpA family protein [bacterium]